MTNYPRKPSESQDSLGFLIDFQRIWCIMYVHKTHKQRDDMGSMKTYLLTDGEFHKIGITTNSVETRIKGLQTGNPRRIECVLWFDGNHESALHNLFARFRVSGEWFRLSDTQIQGMINFLGLPEGDIHFVNFTEAEKRGDCLISEDRRLAEAASIFSNALLCDDDKFDATSVVKTIENNLSEFLGLCAMGAVVSRNKDILDETLEDEVEKRTRFRISQLWGNSFS